MRRAGVAVATIVLALIGTFALVAVLQSRDDANLQAPAGEGPGVAAPQETGERLRRGNVVLSYREAGDRVALEALGEELAGPPDAELEELGQAVIVERATGQQVAVVARAYERRLEADGPEDPALRRFVEAYLGAAAARE